MHGFRVAVGRSLFDCVHLSSIIPIKNKPLPLVFIDFVYTISFVSCLEYFLNAIEIIMM